MAELLWTLYSYYNKKIAHMINSDIRWCGKDNKSYCYIPWHTPATTSKHKQRAPSASRACSVWSGEVKKLHHHTTLLMYTNQASQVVCSRSISFVNLKLSGIVALGQWEARSMEGDWICGLELGLEHGVGTLWTQSGAQLVESQGGIIRRVLVL